eukprot:5129901-Pyramimonas_sp.AAC.1
MLSWARAGPPGRSRAPLVAAEADLRSPTSRLCPCPGVPPRDRLESESANDSDCASPGKFQRLRSRSAPSSGPAGPWTTRCWTASPVLGSSALGACPPHLPGPRGTT